MLLRNDKGQIVIDNTKLGHLMTCEWVSWLQDIHHRASPGDKATLFQGTCGHATLADYFTHFDVKRALDLFESLYRTWSETHVEYDDRFTWSAQHKILSTYLGRLRVMGTPFEVISVA